MSDVMIMRGASVDLYKLSRPNPESRYIKAMDTA